MFVQANILLLFRRGKKDLVYWPYNAIDVLMYM